MTNEDLFALTVKYMEKEGGFDLPPQLTKQRLLKYIETVKPSNKYLAKVKGKPFIILKGIRGEMLVHGYWHETLTFDINSLWYNDDFCELMYRATVEGLCVTRLIHLADCIVSDVQTTARLLEQCHEYTDQCYADINAIRQFG